MLLAGASAQLVKVTIFLVKTRRVHLLDFVATGSMPSSHSALMVSLCSIIYLTEGATTPFYVALALMGIVLVDAMGVRRSVGEEGAILHRLIKKASLKFKEPHYALGHTPFQVLVGALIGFVSALVVYYAVSFNLF